MKLVRLPIPPSGHGPALFGPAVGRRCLGATATQVNIGQPRFPRPKNPVQTGARPRKLSAMTLAPPPTQRPSIAAVFARQGFVIVNRMAPEPVLAEVRDHLLARAAAGT